jgi:Methane oxygenase PmoA
MSPRSLLLPFASALFLQAAHAAVEVKQLDDRVRVEIDGALFTELRYTDSPHVYYWPLIGPGGAKMTRSWPMEEVPNEERDHIHHRSMWFSHGLVNGVDFWGETKSYSKPPPHPVGTIAHDKILEAKGGAESGVVKSSQKWTAPDGTIPVTSTQTLRVFSAPANERLFDFETTLTAGDKDVLFGDTKEGTAGIRIAESMRLKRPKNEPPGEGHILNSEGAKDGDAWGKRAAWVDMFGPVNGKVLGIAFMDHPKNPRHPTRWHARDYGLFAANPFCEQEMDKNQPKGAGDFTLKAGQSVTFRYRIWIHEGEGDAAKIAAKFSDFATK